jgi:hypothetical protein
MTRDPIDMPSDEHDHEHDDEHEDFDLKESLGLPDRLPPLRLPVADELAGLARDVPFLAQARRLAGWLEEGRRVEGDELGGADVVEAARAVGIEIPGIVTTMRDVPEFVHLWSVAEETGFIDFDEDEAANDGVARPGDGLREWPDGTAEQVLDVWDAAFTGILADSLLIDTDYLDTDRGADLDFEGVSVALIVLVFLNRGEGLPIAELSTLLEETATVELSPREADVAWRTWIGAHGDPAEVLLDRLADLGAVVIDEDDVRTTALANWSVRNMLVDSGVEVPLSPPVEEMDAQDLIESAQGSTEEELNDEAAAWFELHDPVEAVRELLEVARSGGPFERMFGTSLAAQAGSAAEPVWREMLDEPELRPYAKMALAQLGGVDLYEAPAGLEMVLEDVAWMLTDVLATSVDSPEEIAGQVKESIPPGQEDELFAVMWRLPHPDAADVLTAIGEHHPDRRIAKSARKAAFKASSKR